MPLCGTSQLPAGHAPPNRVDALRVLVGWAVEAALLAAGSSSSATGAQTCGRNVSDVRVTMHWDHGKRQHEISDCTTFSAGRSNG